MKIISREFLPSTTPSVHAATMAFFRGHPVYAWFGGSREGAQDVAIYLHNLNGDNKTIIIGGNDGVPRWNPILMPIEDKLFLFTKAGIFCDRWQTFVHNVTNWSNDITNKEIFNTANMLPAGLNGPVKTKPVIIDDSIYCGSSVETIYDWTSYIEKYRYDGKNFSYDSRSNPLFVREKKIYQDYNGVTRSSLGVIQPTLWKDSYDNIYCLMRSSRPLGRVYYSRASNDRGLWEEAVPTKIPNPNSGIDVVNMNQKLYLAYNPSENSRMPLAISLIEQGEELFNGVCIGKTSDFTCKDTLIIKDEVVEKNPFISPELSYPYMVEQEGKLHLVYTYGRTRIEYCIIDVN